MQPGEHLALTTKNGKIEKNKVNTTEYTAWTGGKIYFNNETLLNLARELERWYEVKFQFADEHIKSYRFTGVVNKEKSLEYTLKLIQEINKIDFESDNEQIIIKNAK
jgi:ferric-dicitrate binding protein FerR (iron transport regulator)